MVFLLLVMGCVDSQPMQSSKRTPIGVDCKSAQQDRRNFSVRVAARMRGKIARTRLLPITRRGAPGFASTLVATLQPRKLEGKK
jgi:hypothetical protein